VLAYTSVAVDIYLWRLQDGNSKHAKKKYASCRR
jgi:hypothetical protein